MPEVATAPRPIRRSALWRLATRLGVTGFGGGYAMLAQMRPVIVDREGWLSDEEYLEVVAVAQSLPGATAANVFTQLGYRAAGLAGAALATTLFLLPSAALMVLFGHFYARLHGIGRIEAAFAGMNPAVVAIIAVVAWHLARSNRKPWQIAVAVVSMLAVGARLLGVFEVIVLAIVGGVAQGIYRTAEARGQPPALAVAPIFVAGLGLLLPQLAIVFLRIGASTFGGGFAMIPILDHEVVTKLGWLRPAEFADAVTLGQITPGPVAITATFVGYRVAGFGGAVIATVATFLPAFIASVLATRFVAAFRQSALVAGAFQALGPVVAGIVAAAAISLGRSTLHGWVDVAVVAGSLLALIRLPPLAVLALAGLVRFVAA